MADAPVFIKQRYGFCFLDGRVATKASAKSRVFDFILKLEKVFISIRSDSVRVINKIVGQ